MRKHTPIFLASVIAGLLVAGCAVLTVDVDVYKGPLANQEHIQGEQVISMAMGVKPLLVQLRDQLEVSRLVPWFNEITPAPGYANSLEKKLSQLRTNEFYKPGYINVYSVTETNRVGANGVVTKEIETNGYIFRNEFGARVNEILDLYEDGADSEFLALLTKIRTLAQTYQGDFQAMEPGNLRGETNWWEPLKTLADKSSQTNLDLISQYEHFFYRVPQTTSAKRTTFAHWLFPDPTNDPHFNPTKNAEFSQLMAGKAKADAERLFPGTTDIAATNRAEFISEVNNISVAFFAARGDLQQLLQATLEIIPQAHLELTRGVIDHGTFQRLRDHASDIASQLIVGDRVTQKMEPTEKTRFDVILKTLSGKVTSEGILLDLSSNREDREVFKEAVRQFLKDDDGTLCVKLLKYDRELSIDGNIANRYGLACAPVEDFWAEETRLNPDEFSSWIGELKGAAGGSLHGGRPQRGLETLIENYLDQPVEERTPTNAAFQDLLDGMTEFAQKVVTLGNTAKLLHSGNTSEVQQYVSVLQSIGNAIIVQIDELKARAANSQNLQARSELIGEAAAEAGFTNASLTPWPPSTSSTRDARLDAKDAIEQLETVLQLEYLNILHQQALMTLGSSADGAKNKTNILATETNLEFIVDISTNRMVTNANVTAPDFGGAAAKKPVTSGTNVLIGLGDSNSFTFLPLAGPTNSPKQSSVTGTNLVLKLAVSTNGLITNAVIVVMPATTNQTNDILSGPSEYKVSVSISTDALITNVLVTPVTNSTGANSPGSQSLPSIGLTLDVSGRMSNSPPIATTNSPDKFLALLEKTTEVRAGMVYLRPASSYLRSSYPASTLLKDQGQVWHNMLGEQMRRGLPFYSAFQHNSRAEILSELDKQSWQNINRVRVAGVNKVNYVIAKDDVGNWYIKSFSSDPTNVFKSVAGLASYAAGGSLPGLAKAAGAAAAAVTNAASKTTNSAPVSTATAGTASSADTSVLDTEFMIVASNYLSQTSNTMVKLSGSAASLDKTITNAWFAPGNILTNNDTNVLMSIQSNVFSAVYTSFTDASNLLAAATNSAITNGPQAMAAATKYDQQTTDLLTKVSAYEGDVLTNISQQTWSGGSNVPPTLCAKAVAAVGVFLDNYFEERQKAMDACEASLNLINQASNSK
jgi:hypothetical protein